MNNILVLSCGTRNKIIQYFKNALTTESGHRIGNIIAADMSNLAPAAYEADKFYFVPPITSSDYIDIVLNICKYENINAVLSLIDPELSLLAKNKKRFEEIGVTVIGSSYELCEMSLDKMQMYHWLTEHGFKTAKSYNSVPLFIEDQKKGLIDYPVFVKPICGSASIAISKVNNEKMLAALCDGNINLMIQEYLNGQEIGADVYIDMFSGEVVSIFTKKKLVMRAGETDKSVSFKDEKLFDLIKRFVKEAGYRFQIDIDIFEVDGDYYISEVNPRFGGGYPHAYECGCDHMKLIINNICGITNKANIGNYDSDVYMMKYNDIKVTRA